MLSVVVMKNHRARTESEKLIPQNKEGCVTETVNGGLCQRSQDQFDILNVGPLDTIYKGEIILAEYCVMGHTIMCRIRNVENSYCRLRSRNVQCIFPDSEKALPGLIYRRGPPQQNSFPIEDWIQAGEVKGGHWSQLD